MSRYWAKPQVEAMDTVAYGFDHIVGPFLQIWMRGQDQGEKPEIDKEYLASKGKFNCHALAGVLDTFRWGGLIANTPELAYNIDRLYKDLEI
jgi:hypothetical protein